VEKAKDDLFERERLEKAAADKRNTAAKVDAKKAAQYAKERSQLMVQAMKEGEEKEIAQENLRFSELAAALRKYHIDTTEAEEQHRKNVLKIQVKYLLERQAKINQSIQDEKDSIQRGFDELAAIETQDKERVKANADNVLKVRTEAAALRAEIFEGELLKARAVFFSKKRTDKEIEQYDKDVAKAREIFQLEEQAAQLQNQLEFNKSLNDAEKAGLEEQIKNIGLKIGQLKAGTGEGGGTKPKSIAELLGLSEDDVKNLNSVKDSVISILGDISAARLEEAEAAVEAAQMKVDAAQTAYDEEKKKSEDGVANNLLTATQNLENAKVEEEKALKLKQDAQKKQLQLDTAMQLSSLVTAAANTFKGFSTIPLIGQILAVASVAAMFAAFAAARARASAAIKFEKGGRVDADNLIHGNRHSDGGVMIEAEGGEFILNRKSSAKYPDIAKALNRGDEAAILRAASRLNRDAVTGAIGEAKGGTVTIIAKDDKTAHGLLKQIRDKRGEGSTTIENGYSVTRIGNRTTRKRL
jgi:hypothetical protein